MRDQAAAMEKVVVGEGAAADEREQHLRRLELLIENGFVSSSSPLFLFPISSMSASRVPGMAMAVARASSSLYGARGHRRLGP